MYFKLIVLVGLLLLAVFITHVARIMLVLGFHVTVYNHTPGPCRLVPGVDQGSEDMETLPNGLAFITSGIRSPFNSEELFKWYSENNYKGRILLFDFNHPENGVSELEFEKTFDQSTFYPHGISILQNEKTGTITLFVVSHPPDADRIEKFEFIAEKQLLVHKKSYTDPAMRIVNDVAATSEDSFYLTNFGYYRDNVMRWFETHVVLPWQNIVYCDGEHCQVVVDSLAAPNGILLSKDKRTLYAASIISRSIGIYQRENNNAVTLLQEFPLYASPDNLLLEPRTGNILVGAHPSPYLIADHIDHPINPSFRRAPSKVLMVEMKNASHPTSITELYSDDGTRLQGASVAAIHDNKMLIGTVIDRLMFCDVRTL